MILFTDAMKDAAKQIKSGLTWRVLHLLPEHLNFTDFKQIRNAGLAAELDTHAGNVSRAMRELQGLGILDREGKGPRTAWRFSSDWGWQGTADQYHAFRGGRLGKRRPQAERSVECMKSHNEYYGKKGHSEPSAR